MGMAAYGKPTYKDQFRDIIRFDRDKLVVSNLDYFTYQHGQGMLSKKFYDLFGDARKPFEPIEQRHMDIASTAQWTLERIVCDLARLAREITGLNKLCLAGGVALNCVANGRIYQERIFDGLWVQPAAGDDGGSLGAAYYVHNTLLGNSRTFQMNSANVGPEYSNEEIEKVLTISKVAHRKSNDVCAEVAKRIADGKIVGWFQGKMEFGPRALGSRSILGDATNPGMKDLINASVKFREEFRPFAPSVKAEAASHYFDIDFDSPYMLFVVDVLEDAKPKLPAITHVDGTARIRACGNRTSRSTGASSMSSRNSREYLSCSTRRST